jgi:hypothetical protein
MSLEQSMNLLIDSLLSLEGRLISLEKAVAEKQEPISEDWAAARLDEIVWRLERLEQSVLADSFFDKVVANMIKKMESQNKMTLCDYQTAEMKL